MNLFANTARVRIVAPVEVAPRVMAVIVVQMRAVCGDG
jgi:hypothetical protein